VWKYRLSAGRLDRQQWRAPTKPSQRDIDSGVAIQVKEYMKALVPYVHAGSTAFLRQNDPDFKGMLAEVKLAISPDAKTASKNFREPWQMSKH